MSRTTRNRLLAAVCGTAWLATATVAVAYQNGNDPNDGRGKPGSWTIDYPHGIIYYNAVDPRFDLYGKGTGRYSFVIDLTLHGDQTAVIDTNGGQASGDYGDPNEHWHSTLDASTLHRNCGNTLANLHLYDVTSYQLAASATIDVEGVGCNP